MHHDKADCRNCSLVAHAIGLVIGHEISRAFDDHGSQFDGEGNLRSW
jgi:predicted metalloendopeptidase